MKKGAGDGNALRLPARKLDGIGARLLRKPCAGKHIRYAGAVFADEEKVSGNGQVRDEAGLLENIGTGLPGRYFSFVRANAREHIQQGGFPAAAFAEDAGDLPFFQREGKIVVDGEASVLLGDIAQFYHCRASFPCLPRVQRSVMRVRFPSANSRMPPVISMRMVTANSCGISLYTDACCRMPPTD